MLGHTVGITYRPTTSAKYLTAILVVFCEFVSLFFRLLSPLTLFFSLLLFTTLRSPVHVFQRAKPQKHSRGNVVPWHRGVTDYFRLQRKGTNYFYIMKGKYII